MSCDHELANEKTRCSGKNASYITTKDIAGRLWHCTCYDYHFVDKSTVTFSCRHNGLNFIWCILCTKRRIWQKCLQFMSCLYRLIFLMARNALNLKMLSYQRTCTDSSPLHCYCCCCFLFINAIVIVTVSLLERC